MLPHGFLSLPEREELALSIGANIELATETGASYVGDDPHYKNGGGDALTYEIPVADIPGEPVAVKATLHSQAIPPFYLQDRFCTAKGSDTDRLYFLAGHLNLAGTEAENWRIAVSCQCRVIRAGACEWRA